MTNKNNEEEYNLKLYNALIKQRELQYKFDKFKQLYLNNQNKEKLEILRTEILHNNYFIIDSLIQTMQYYLNLHSGYNESNISILNKIENIELELEIVEKSDDIQKQRVAIETALNAVHQAGPMLDYFGLSDEMMKNLNNLDTNLWDKQLLFSSNKIKIKLSKRDV